MNTPKKIRYLTCLDTVRRGDFIRQGDSGFEYCTEFGRTVPIELRYRKVKRVARIGAWISSFFGREGLWGAWQ